MPSATQVLRNTAESLPVYFSVDGSETDADGEVTVTVTRDDGTALVTGATATHPTFGRYEYQLSPQTNLDRLTLQWTGTFSGVYQPAAATTYVDIVGAYYVSLTDLRAEPTLADTNKFTVSKLITARQWFETLAEQYCGQAFVPRYKRIRISGDGSSTLLLDPNIRTVRSVTTYTSATEYTTFTADELAGIDIDPVGVLTRWSATWPYGNRNIEIVYEHGMDACPGDLADAALDATRRHLLENQTGRTVLSVADDLGVTRYSTPGMGRPTGYAEVDSVLNRYRMVSVG